MNSSGGEKTDNFICAKEDEKISIPSFIFIQTFYSLSQFALRVRVSSLHVLIKTKKGCLAPERNVQPPRFEARQRVHGIEITSSFTHLRRVCIFPQFFPSTPVCSHPAILGAWYPLLVGGQKEGEQLQLEVVLCVCQPLAPAALLLESC